MKKFFSDLPYRQEEPLSAPGALLRDHIMRWKDLSTEDILAKSDLSEKELSAFFNGEARFDENLKRRLRPAIGDAVEVLQDRQKSTDYYSQHGRWPKSSDLSNTP